MKSSPFRTLYSADRLQRVIIFRRDDDTFGFESEHFSQEPLEQCWLPTGGFTVSYCDCEERALSEAIARVPWLAEMVDRHELVEGLGGQLAAGCFREVV